MNARPYQPLHLNSNGDDELTRSTSNNDEDENDNEETLLKVSLSINDEHTIDDAIPIIHKYLTSFPFSAVLPVQPLSYTPRNDGKGVKVSFLRKKTQEKSSHDGGIDFTFSIEKGDSSKSNRVNIVANRNSEGQFVSKVFTEGVVIKAFVNGLNYGEDNGGRVGIGYDNLIKICTVESIFHKWM